MKLLNKLDFLSACAMQFEDVEIKGIGFVRICTMTGAEREDWRQSLVAKEGEAVDVSNYSASILVATAVGDDGKKLFSVEDIPIIKNAPAGRFDAAVIAAYRLNGLGGDAIEEAAKNSDSGQSEDSGSDSQKN